MITLSPFNFLKQSIFSLIFTLTTINIAFAGDRLLATGGVSQMEGSAGGGLTPWALIAGYGTDKQVGGSVFFTEARTRGGFELISNGFSLGFNNRIEISMAQQRFGLGDTVKGETIRLNTLGFKVRLFGDAIYDQDTWLPQLSAGIQYKSNDDYDKVPTLLGAKKADGIDMYLSASKLMLGAVAGRNLLLNGTLQATKANQFGLLGFGGDLNNDYKIQPDISVALMLTDNLLVGSEYRVKPNNLSIYKEDNAKDVFATWFVNKNISITAAYLDLGNIADKDNQTGWYVSGQLSY